VIAGPGLRVASAGEAVVDLTPLGDEVDGLAFRAHLGGSPFNVAVALARLGVGAGFASCLSTDAFGRRFRDHLRECGASAELTVDREEPSSLAFVDFQGRDARYAFHFVGTASPQLAPEDLPLERMGELTVFHFGSVALLFEPFRSTVLGIAEALRSRVLLSFDPNVRPNLVRDWDEYRALLRHCLQLADIVRLSNEDAEVCAPDPAALLGGGGPAVIVLTRGAAGSTIHLPGGTETVPAQPCTPVDTIGAGDAYTAGLLAALLARGVTDRGSLERVDAAGWRAAGAFAATCSAITCERDGAQFPSLDEVEVRRTTAPG
jgi:fructokinase